jgi:hypothetical protein
VASTHTLSFIPQNFRRLLAAHHTTDRRVENVLHVVASFDVEPVFARCELDSYAHTCALAATSFLCHTLDVSVMFHHTIWSNMNRKRTSLSLLVPQRILLKTMDKHIFLSSMKVFGLDLSSVIHSGIPTNCVSMVSLFVITPLTSTILLKLNMMKLPYPFQSLARIFL